MITLGKQHRYRLCTLSNKEVTKQELWQLQEVDAVLGPVILWKHKDRRPGCTDLVPLSPAAKCCLGSGTPQFSVKVHCIMP